MTHAKDLMVRLPVKLAIDRSLWVAYEPGGEIGCVNGRYFSYLAVLFLCYIPCCMQILG